MKALLCKAFGPPDSLLVEDLPDPVAGKGEIAVDVFAIGLNFLDTLIIENKYQTKPPLPFSPGAEFSGKVACVGAGVTRIKPGDRVAGYIGFGACRSKLVCAEDALVQIPDDLSYERAAGLSVTYGTALHALKQRADLKPGETLAVLGASGGAGIAAVEIGRLMGARVIACASSAKKISFAKGFGAAAGIDYSSADLKQELKRLTEGQGVDVIYDPVGGDLTEPALRATAWKGRLLVIGFAAGAIPKVPLNLVLLKGCDVRGVFFGEFVRRQPQQQQENMRQLCAWAAPGALRAPVHAVFPLAAAAQALAVLKRREAFGKVLLRP